MNYLIPAGDHTNVPEMHLDEITPWKKVSRIPGIVPYEKLHTQINGGADTISVAGTGDHSALQRL